MQGYMLFIYCLQPRATFFSLLSDTSVHWNKHKCLPHNSSQLCLFPPPLLTLVLSLSPSLLCSISSLQSTAGPPSPRPVNVLFHLACCYRGLRAGRLQLGSQSFSIYQSPLPVCLQLLPAPPPNTHIHTQQTTLTALTSINPNTVILIIPPSKQTSTLPCSLPPSVSSSFDQRGKFSSQAPRRQKKEILCQWKHFR